MKKDFFKDILIALIISFCITLIITSANIVNNSNLDLIIPALATILGVLLMILTMVYMFLSTAMIGSSKGSNKFIQFVSSTKTGREISGDYVFSTKVILFCLVVLILMSFMNLPEPIIPLYAQFGINVTLFIKLFVTVLSIVQTYYSIDLFKEIIDGITSSNIEK